MAAAVSAGATRPPRRVTLASALRREATSSGCVADLMAAGIASERNSSAPGLLLEVLQTLFVLLSGMDDRLVPRALRRGARLVLPFSLAAIRLARSTPPDSSADSDQMSATAAVSLLLYSAMAVQGAAAWETPPENTWHAAAAALAKLVGGSAGWRAIYAAPRAGGGDDDDDFALTDDWSGDCGPLLRFQARSLARFAHSLGPPPPPREGSGGRPQCVQCGAAAGVKLKACSACRAARFCSTECAKRAWTTPGGAHCREACRAAAAAASAAAAAVAAGGSTSGSS